MNATIAAVVVTYNRKELLRECLQALLNQTRPLDEIIVIDNASTDGTDKMLPEEFPHVTYVRLPDNIGGAGGFHEGMKLAYEKGNDWIWVMDDDAIASDDALEKLLDLLPLPNDVYALASAVLYPDGRICAIHRRLFDPIKVQEQPIALEYYDRDYFETDTVSFVGMFVSRETITKIGLPLKDFFIYYDDTEYCLRIRSHGGRIFTLPKSRILHKTSGGEMQHVERHRTPLSWRNFYVRRNQLYTYRKYGNIGFKFYLKLLVSILRSQTGIILFRRCKFASTKIIWMSVFDGLKGKLGKTIEP